MTAAFFRWPCPDCHKQHTRRIQPDLEDLHLLTVTTFPVHDPSDIGPDPRLITRPGDLLYTLAAPVDLTCDYPDDLIPDERSTP